MLSLLLLELGIRILAPVELHATDTYMTGRRVQSGSMILVPGVSARQKTSEFDVGIRINSEGMRDREFTRKKPPGIFRILVLGDSQTFGSGVEAHQTYCKVLERLLSERTRRKFEVINTGVPSSGTAHQLWILEDKGWSFEPDMVVLGFFYNDFLDNMENRLYAIRGGQIVRLTRPVKEVTSLHEVLPQEVPRPDFRAIQLPEPIKPPQPPFLIRHSHLARFARQAVANLLHSERARPVERIPARQITARYLEEVTRQCREREVPYLILLIPSLQQYGDKRIITLSELWKRELKGAVRSDREIVDPWRTFEKHGFRRLFFPQDTHLRPDGHRLVAEALSERILQHLRERKQVSGRD